MLQMLVLLECPDIFLQKKLIHTGPTYLNFDRYLCVYTFVYIIALLKTAEKKTFISLEIDLCSLLNMVKQAAIFSFVCNLHEHEYIVKGKVLNITPLMCLINGFEENSIR